MRGDLERATMLETEAANAPTLAQAQELCQAADRLRRRPASGGGARTLPFFRN